MELENIVANTVYIKAKESGANKDKRRSKKWRDILAFPHVSIARRVLQTIDISYNYVVSKQPIGKQLFLCYCRSKYMLKNLIDFIELTDAYEVDFDESGLKIANEIAIKYIHPDALYKITHFPDELVNDVISKLEKLGESECPPRDIFSELICLANSWLKHTVFLAFTKTIYFDRYLQWKWLEMQPVNKDTFRMYRVLGKGGFGEVCACQVRATGKLYACKKLEKKRIKKRHGEQLAYAEKKILQKVNSRFVLWL